MSGFKIKMMSTLSNILLLRKTNVASSSLSSLPSSLSSKIRLSQQNYNYNYNQLPFFSKNMKLFFFSNSNRSTNSSNSNNSTYAIIHNFGLYYHRRRFPFSSWSSSSWSSSSSSSSSSSFSSILTPLYLTLACTSSVFVFDGNSNNGNNQINNNNSIAYCKEDDSNNNNNDSNNDSQMVINKITDISKEIINIFQNEKDYQIIIEKCKKVMTDNQMLSKPEDIIKIVSTFLYLDNNASNNHDIMIESSYGFFCGLTAGYTIKKFSKVLGLTIGFIFITIQLLSSYGYMEVNHKKIEEEILKTIDINNDGVIDDEDIKFFYEKLMKLLEYNLPKGSGFAMGVLLGWKKG